MHTTPHHPHRRRDGSRTGARPRRPLRLDPEPGTALLRSGQTGRCCNCGNAFEWYHRTDHRPVRLHPKELPAAFVPGHHRWHVSAGLAYPAGDGTAWCRLPHAALCPKRAPDPALVHLAPLRRYLALNTRHLIDTGRFTPHPRPDRNPCRPSRPVVQILGIRYLAAHPVDDIRCLARTHRTRTRCTGGLAAPGRPSGVWRMLPVTVCDSEQLALPARTDMAVYDLSDLPYAEQLRWRTQRCRDHASARAEMGTADWEPFDPLLHHEHIHPRLPADHTPRTTHSTRPTSRCRYP
ncbi:DUF6083 domain-containing protein [Streptomyces sp. NPDC020983]|uniref:DUF6083 domain-containing protein n=1 Tax=Streptomyces sp. NPDC020983 TaxID=3365106 RepID=UPI00378C7258